MGRIRPPRLHRRRRRPLRLLVPLRSPLTPYRRRQPPLRLLYIIPRLLPIRLQLLPLLQLQSSPTPSPASPPIQCPSTQYPSRHRCDPYDILIIIIKHPKAWFGVVVEHAHLYSKVHLFLFLFYSRFYSSLNFVARFFVFRLVHLRRYFASFRSL
ncbi:hypothetical protein C8J57DRAFT_1302602 [Mycena rebaudengoi]|nr:hypothetical protein C8J57DRAFT_1302602 [Mycena rebaudengoi]